MMFCPKCGAILLPKKVDNKNTMACSSCGFVDKNPSATLTEKSGKETRRCRTLGSCPAHTTPHFYPVGYCEVIGSYEAQPRLAVSEHDFVSFLESNIA